MRLCVSSYSMDLQLHSVLVFDVITKPLDATCVWSVPPPVTGRRYNSWFSWPHSPDWGRIQGSALPLWYKTILKDTHT